MESSDRIFDLSTLKRCDLMEFGCNELRLVLTVLKVNDHDVAVIVEYGPDMDDASRASIIGSALGESPKRPHGQRFTSMQAIVGQCLVYDVIAGDIATFEIHSLRVTRGDEVIFDQAGGEPGSVHNLRP